MENSSRIAFRVSRISIYLNAALSAVKLLAGLLARSGAMVSDAVHSISDVFSTFIVMIGVHLSGKESDREHPYGHERMECVAAIVLAGVLLATGLMIGYQGVEKILRPEELQAPGILALIAAVLSIGVKEGMYRYTRKAARQIDSDALMADAWHHRSDALSSVGALIGIGGARLGLPILDPIASLVICLFIAKAAYEIFRDAVNKMVDESADEETEAALRACALAHPGVKGIDRLLTRKFGSKMYVEMEISVDGEMTLTAAHDIAEGVHNDIERQFSKVKHIMIHVNPAQER
ncbi:MAG: cation diffusion facilitator family transporter [Clostridiales bacterium]|nr:cation diffusion facilitator family transporter [Clostridiales bacterium]